MSQEAVMKIIEQASKDERFRQLLFKKPREALAGYELTATERQTLENLNEDTFDEFAGTLGDRDTKGFIPSTGI